MIGLNDWIVEPKAATDFNAKTSASRMRDVLEQVPPEWKATVTATTERRNPDIGWFPGASAEICVAPVLRI